MDNGAGKLKKIFPFIILGLITLLFFYPFLKNPETLLSRNNDLAWLKSQYSFVKKYLLEFKYLPIWQNYYLSGSPLLGDQNQLLYPLFYLSIFIPLNYYFFIFCVLHTMFGLFSTYLLSRTLKFNKFSSVCSAIIYTFSAYFISHLLAGHLNLLVAFYFYPLFVYSAINIVRKPKFQYSLIFSLSLASIYLNYSTIFIYSLITTPILLLILKKANMKHILIALFSGFLLFVLLVFPQLLTNILYFPLTTRDLITVSDLEPHFIAYRSFIYSILYPYKYLSSYNSEQILYLGLIALILAAVGFLSLKKRFKVYFLISSGLILLIAIGNKIKLYSFLVKLIPYLLLFRVTTRIWFIFVLMIALLAGLGLTRIKYKFLKLLILLLIVGEAFHFLRVYTNLNFVKIDTIGKPPEAFRKTALLGDSYFRIYCTSSCFNNVFEEGKGLATGYNPLQLKNYFYYLQKAGGYKFNSYTPSLPPYQTFVDKPVPDPQLLGYINVRYILSTYPVNLPDLTLVDSDNTYYLYRNYAEKPRVFFAATEESIIPTKDLPGYMEIPVNNRKGEIIIGEVYTPFWKAYDDLGGEIKVENKDPTLGIILTKEIKTLKVVFKPPLVNLGFLLSNFSWIFCIFYLFIILLRLHKR